MHKSILTFVLLASSLVMLAAMPLFYNNGLLNTAMAQGYDNNYYGDSSSYSQYPQTTRNTNVELVPLKAFL